MRFFSFMLAAALAALPSIAAADNIQQVCFTGANGRPTCASPTNGLPVSNVGHEAVAGATFARPADTTAYAVGDLVANSTTAGSVVPMAVAAGRTVAGTGQIINVRLSKSSASLTNAAFRVHLFKSLPTTTAGDNAAFAGATNGVAAVYIGYVDVTMDQAFSDGAKGSSAGPTSRPRFIFETGVATANLYALIEARGAYTPASAETFTVALELIRN